MSKEATKLALEALEDFEDAIRYDNEQDDIGERVCCGVLSYNPHAKDCNTVKAITALREALAEQPTPVHEPYFRFRECEDSQAEQQAPVQQEPVAELLKQSRANFEHNFGKGGQGWADWIYSDIAELLSEHTSPQPAQRKPLTHEVINRDFYGRVDFVRLVEAHNIKENT